MLLPQRPNLLGQKPLIQPIIPLGQPLRLRNLVRISQGPPVRRIKGNLKGFQRSPARTDIHMRDMGRVNQSAGANDHLPRGEDLLLAIGGEFQLAGTGVSAAFGPFRLSWIGLDVISRVMAGRAGRTVSVEEDARGAGVFVWHCCNGAAIHEGSLCVGGICHSTLELIRSQLKGVSVRGKKKNRKIEKRLSAVPTVDSLVFTGRRWWY